MFGAIRLKTGVVSAEVRGKTCQRKKQKLTDFRSNLVKNPLSSIRIKFPSSHELSQGDGRSADFDRLDGGNHDKPPVPKKSRPHSGTTLLLLINSEIRGMLRAMKKREYSMQNPLVG